MLLETYQHRPFIKQTGDILTTARFREMPRDLNWPKELYAYDWLRTQYQQRRLPLNTHHALIWAWPQLPVGLPAVEQTDRRVAMVHLWLDVPDEIVLSMNFQAWCLILIGDSLDHNQALVDSWQRLFDEAWLVAHDIASADNWDRQVVLPYVKRDWIKRVKYLRGVR
ncbi:hypothetical protein BB562_00405 [Lactiplantibacillus pentosus]|uniref:DUF3841 domain-containing protein n=1 Tax=Lactiplantibacillus pentosus TaxID=1589 RepID=UPI000C7E4F9E|nr:DUF3841 domain-containing protein [Lactiplantibacillus pentosus]AUI77258.1 hypothetical protein BB562_00405 [Lactiplantibacillus pentosus]MCE6031152.1 DUF3841 domain-containing protein [Lactiplantibacillus pentosus]MCT3275672.1 DUF3841 domain-containing protein [Lactiplantibacillus pentosus]